jgi:hypothetical protein
VILIVFHRYLCNVRLRTPLAKGRLCGHGTEKSIGQKPSETNRQTP